MNLSACAQNATRIIGHYEEGACSELFLEQKNGFALGFLIAQCIVLGMMFGLYCWFVARRGQPSTTACNELPLFMLWVLATAFLVGEYTFVLLFNLYHVTARAMEWSGLLVIVCTRLYSNHHSHPRVTQNTWILVSVISISVATSFYLLVAYWLPFLGSLAILIFLFAWFAILQILDVVLSLSYCSESGTGWARTVRLLLSMISLILPFVGIYLTIISGQLVGVICFALAKMVMTLTGFFYVFSPPPNGSTGKTKVFAEAKKAANAGVQAVKESAAAVAKSGRGAGGLLRKMDTQVFGKKERRGNTEPLTRDEF